MNGKEFKRIREAAELERGEMADILLFPVERGRKTIKEIEQPRSGISGPVSVIMRLIEMGYLDAVIQASEREEEGAVSP